jgi:hypothetical protein
MPGKDSSQPEKHMVKFSIYLYRECARARQEGVVVLPTNLDSQGLVF